MGEKHSHTGFHPWITFVLILGLSGAKGRIGQLEKALNKLSTREPIVNTEIVDGRTNTYLNISGQKVYSMIGGKSITDYLSSSNSNYSASSANSQEKGLVEKVGGELR